MSTNVIIHNGNQIGGCVTIISTETARIMIDFGQSLPGSKSDADVDFDWKNEEIDAVFFTHYHGDHIGRYKEIPTNIPLYMGELTRMVMTTIAKHIEDREAQAILKDDGRIVQVEADEPIEIGDIRVTPYMVDHSAYDAYMYLIETADKVILHTGDFRGHGYRGKAVIPTIRKYVRQYGKRDVDILITEGTMMSRLGEKVYSEKDMLRDARQLFSEEKYVFLICSSTNLDSLATFYNAAKEYGRKTYANGYVCEQLENFTKVAGKHTPLYKFDDVSTIGYKKILENEDKLREEGFLIIIKAEDAYRKWVDRFKDLNPKIVYSMWEGYLNPEKNAFNPVWKGFMDSYGNTKVMHTSGHAIAKMLESVINEVNPQEMIYQIHTENVGAFKKLKIKAELKTRIREDL